MISFQKNTGASKKKAGFFKKRGFAKAIIYSPYSGGKAVLPKS